MADPALVVMLRLVIASIAFLPVTLQLFTKDKDDAAAKTALLGGRLRSSDF